MSEWSVIWLGVMAAALVIMATVQIGLIVVVLRLGRELSRTADELRREVQPLVAKAHQVVDDAAKATALAALQIERLDTMIGTTAARVDQVAGFVQAAFGGPVRKGVLAFSVLRAVMSAFRNGPTRRGRSAHGHDEEDALFVG